MKEEYAIVLDFLPYGYAASFKKEPVVQAIGENTFALLELIAKPSVSISLREKVYIGPEFREKIKYVKRRLNYNGLTATAKNELPEVVKELVQQNEEKFVEFFNKAGPVTVRLHSLELLPNIGKKHMWAIIEEREKKPFESFKDIVERIPLMPDPVKIITQRILEELQGNTKYRLFVR